MGDYVGLPYVSGSAASKEAAESMLPYAGTSRYRVWRYIVDNPRVTDRDIRDGLGMNRNTVGPRRYELEEAGLIRSDGEVEVSEGKVWKARVWVATGEPYPEDWSAVEKRGVEQRRAAADPAPTPEEIRVAVETVRDAYRVFKELGRPFPPEAVKVMRWLDRKAED